MLFSAAGRDDPDDFFAIVILPVRVHHHQYRAAARLNSNGSERMPALLPVIVNSIHAHQAIGIFENKRRQRE